MSCQPLPPFTPDSAVEKVRLAEDGCNTRDPAKVALAYTSDTRWRNRVEFATNRDEARAFLTRKWNKEHEYRLIKELWAFTGNRIAVGYAYEYRDDGGQWFRAYGNENWLFAEDGLMANRHAQHQRDADRRGGAEVPLTAGPPSGRPSVAERPRPVKPKRALTDRGSALPALAEAFREYGYDGASVAVLSKATGLGKGSLYNFFPGGKEEMMAAVLDDIDRWFVEAIFRPLEDGADPAGAIGSMFDVVSSYFLSGRRVCVVGSLGLNASGALFTHRVGQYFARWIASLARCLERGGVAPASATDLAEEAVSGIQGAIVLSRALGEEAAFRRSVDRLRNLLLDAIGHEGR